MDFQFKETNTNLAIYENLSADDYAKLEKEEHTFYIVKGVGVYKGTTLIATYNNSDNTALPIHTGEIQLAQVGNSYQNATFDDLFGVEETLSASDLSLLIKTATSPLDGSGWYDYRPYIIDYYDDTMASFHFDHLISDTKSSWVSNINGCQAEMILDHDSGVWRIQPYADNTLYYLRDLDALILNPSIFVELVNNNYTGLIVQQPGTYVHILHKGQYIAKNTNTTSSLDLLIYPSLVQDGKQIEDTEKFSGLVMQSAQFSYTSAYNTETASFDETVAQTDASVLYLNSIDVVDHDHDSTLPTAHILRVNNQLYNLAPKAGDHIYIDSDSAINLNLPSVTKSFTYGNINSMANASFTKEDFDKLRYHASVLGFTSYQGSTKAAAYMFKPVYTGLDTIDGATVETIEFVCDSTPKMRLILTLNGSTNTVTSSWSQEISVDETTIQSMIDSAISAVLQGDY